MQLFVKGKEPPGVMITLFDVSRDGRLWTMRRTGGDKRPSPRQALVQRWRAAVRPWRAIDADAARRGDQAPAESKIRSPYRTRDRILACRPFSI